MLRTPRLLADNQEKARLISSLGCLTNEDLILAEATPGVLYLEDYTDLLILREWARILDHPAYDLLTTRCFWKRTVHRDRVTVETRLAPRLGRARLARIDAAVARLGAFHGLPAEHVTG